MTFCLFQVLIEACDQGVPQLCSTAKFTVNINFNLFDPQFLSTACGNTLLETQSLGVPVQTIATVDSDAAAVSS